MRVCSVDKVPENAVLAKDIYDAKGVFLLKRDSRLLQGTLQKLKNNGIFFICIEDGISEGIEFESVIDDESKARIIFAFKEIVEEKTGEGKGVGLVFKNVKKIEGLVDELLMEISRKSDLSYMAVELMGTDMSTYFHSVNTAIISLLMAMDLKMSRTMCRDIGLGAILHDIGKTRIDSRILNKVERFNEEEWIEMKSHVDCGYELIKALTAMNGIVKSIVLKHHEKLDGSGYPNGITAEAIPEYVRIVTVADMFDAMTSDRIYRRRMPIHVALEHLMTECVTKIDKNIYQCLTRKVIFFPPGTIVHLNEGSSAIVTEYNDTAPTRPKIRIIKSSNFAEGTEIDLMNRLTLLIESAET